MGSTSSNLKTISSSNVIYVSILGVILFLSCLLYIDIPNNLSTQLLSRVLILMSLSTAVFMLYTKKHVKNFKWISILFFFLLSYVIVHFQMQFIHILGFELQNRYLEWFVWASGFSGNKSSIISLFGLLSFYIGFILSKYKPQVSHSKRHSELKHSNTLLLVLCAYIFYILFFLTSGSYRSGMYAAGDESSVSVYFFTAFNNMIMAALAIRLYKINLLSDKKYSLVKYIQFIGLPISILICWHMLFSLYVGDRGPVLTFSLFYFGLYFIRWKKVNIIPLLFFVSVFGSLFTFIGQLRVTDNSKNYLDRVNTTISDDKGNDRYKTNDIPLAGTIELAFSGRCLNHSVENVPSKYDYKYGYYQLGGLVEGIPFLGKPYLYFLGGNDWRFAGTSNFISYLIQGNNPEYGDGRTVVADLYLDFGPIGVMVGLFAFGFFIRRADLNLSTGNNSSMFFWIACLIYLSSAIYIGRSSILFVFQKIMHVYILFWINYIFNRVLKMNTY